MLAQALDSRSKTRGHSVFPALSSHDQMWVGWWLGKVFPFIFLIFRSKRRALNLLCRPSPMELHPQHKIVLFTKRSHCHKVEEDERQVNKGLWNTKGAEVTALPVARGQAPHHE